MASYTDSVPKFNPYVKQLPLEAMVKVGTYKQEKYDEGIQKIQTNIDNIAGLDVVRDVDKAYLQSKLNQLGNDLTTVAAGDFSNFQLVNSVNGMTNQIAKDPNVVSALSSTAFLRKQQTEMEKAISEGKSSQSNIYDFNQKAAAYTNSDKVGETFNGRYTQYTDVKKKALDTIKALNPDLLKYDIPFVDENGRIDQTRIADAMKRYKIEGVSPEKIAQALHATLTPDDLNQLRIDAKYEFRGVGPEQLAIKAKQDYDVRRSQAISELDKLQIEKAVNTDPTKQDDLDNQIEHYKDLLGGDGKIGRLDENFYSNVKQARTNPDEVKYNIYKDGFISEYANAFKSSKQEMEYVENPLMKRQQWIAEMKLKQNEFQQRKYEFGVNSQFKQTELGLKQQENQLKAEENAMTKASLYGVDAPWTDLGNPTDYENRGQELFSNHQKSVDNEIEGSRNALKAKGYSDDYIDQMIKDWNDAQGVTSKANIKANAIGEIQNIVKNQNYFDQLTYFQKRTRAESEKEAGVAGIINKNLEGKTGINFNHHGERINLSPREIVDFELAVKEVPGEDNEGHSIMTKVIDTGKLNDKQLKYAEATYGKSAFGKTVNGKLVSAGLYGHPTSSISDRQAIDKITRPHVYAANQIREAYNKSEDIYMDKLGKSAFAFVPKIKAISKNSKGEIPSNTLDGLSQLIVAENAKGIKTDGKWDFGTASSYLTDKMVKDTKVFVEQDGDSYTIKMQNLSDPDNFQSFKVSGPQVKAYLGDNYVNDNVQTSGRFAIGKGNSDINRTNVATNALMQKRFGDFPGIKKLQVTAKLEEDTPGLFIPTVYVKQKDGRYASFELSGDNKLSRVGYEQGIQNLNSLNDDVLEKVLRQAYPNYDFSKLDK